MAADLTKTLATNWKSAPSKYGLGRIRAPDELRL